MKIEKRKVAPPITALEMTEKDIELAGRMADQLGFTQTAYTSTSAMWGLYCLPDSARHKHGCIILTSQFGFLFVADIEDCQLHELHEETAQTLYRVGREGGVTA